jgi:hypothetical protein
MTMKKFMTPFILLIVLTVFLVSQSSVAGPREQAKFMNDRIVGTTISSADFETAVTLITNGQAEQAAINMTERSDFYNIKLKAFFAPRTNESGSGLVEFNDYTATLIGMTRDDVPYTQALTGDIIYVGSAAANSGTYSHTDNEHYKSLHENRVDLSNGQMFTQTTQSGLAGTPLNSGATAGVMTTRAASQAFFVAGTNRAMTRFTTINYLCRDFEQLHDITRPHDRIRKDVSRNKPFLNDCNGCHAGLDGLSGAFAHYNYNTETERLEYNAGAVQEKFGINAGVYKHGFTTVDDSWVNYWRVGQNSSLMFRASVADGVTTNVDFGHTSGSGAKSLGKEISSSKAFSACAVKQVFEDVCIRSGNSLTTADNVEIERISGVFEATNYSYRQIWAQAALFCMGQ